MPRLRARTAVVSIAAAALILTPTGPAAASIPMCPADHSCFYEYFDSPEKEQSIGRTYVDCYGTWDTVGETSPWINFDSTPCV